MKTKCVFYLLRNVDSSLYAYVNNLLGMKEELPLETLVYYISKKYNGHYYGMAKEQASRHQREHVSYDVQMKSCLASK
jgi:hypothetical protein